MTSHTEPSGQWQSTRGEGAPVGSWVSDCGPGAGDRASRAEASEESAPFGAREPERYDGRVWAVGSASLAVTTRARKGDVEAVVQELLGGPEPVVGLVAFEPVLHDVNEEPDGVSAVAGLLPHELREREAGDGGPAVPLASGLGGRDIRRGAGAVGALDDPALAALDKVARVLVSRSSSQARARRGAGGRAWRRRPLPPSWETRNRTIRWPPPVSRSIRPARGCSMVAVSVSGNISSIIADVSKGETTLTGPVLPLVW